MVPFSGDGDTVPLNGRCSGHCFKRNLINLGMAVRSQSMGSASPTSRHSNQSHGLPIGALRQHQTLFSLIPIPLYQTAMTGWTSHQNCFPFQAAHTLEQGLREAGGVYPSPEELSPCPGTATWCNLKAVPAWSQVRTNHLLGSVQPSSLWGGWQLPTRNLGSPSGVSGFFYVRAMLFHALLSG